MNHTIANRLAKLERQAQPPTTQLVIIACNDADAARQLAEARATGRDKGREPFLVMLTPLGAGEPRQ